MLNSASSKFALHLAIDRGWSLLFPRPSHRNISPACGFHDNSKYVYLFLPLL